MSEVNTAFPYRPGYVRAERAGDCEPSPVTARAITADGSVVTQAHAAIVHAKNEFQKHINAVGRNRDHYSDEGFRAQVAGFASTEAAKAVGAAVAQVRERADAAAAHVDKLRRDLSPHGDVTAEMRAGRYWSRTQRVLDNTDNAKLFGAAQNLITTAERTELGVLLEELPAYLESRGQSTDWLDAVIGQALPEYVAAQTQLAKARQARTIIEHNATALRKGFTEGRPPTVLADPGKYDPDR